MFELFGEGDAKLPTTACNELGELSLSDKRRFFAVLHQPPVTSPVDAVRAAIVAEQRAK
jgi:hypothetical protein